MSNMPNEIQEVFDKLHNEILWLCASWAVYKDLFVQPEKRIDLLRESGEYFFYIIRGALLDNIIGVLNNLADPAKSGKFENCSLKQLQNLTNDQDIPGNISGKLQKIITQLHDKSGKKGSPLRMYRNRVLNHFELKTSLGKGSVPNISIETIEESLSLIKAFLNTRSCSFSYLTEFKRNYRAKVTFEYSTK